MATVTTPSTMDIPGAVAVPRLQNGDRLTRPEFERRFDADPTLKKAELINGVVYMASPVRHREHGKPHFHVIYWMGIYVAATSGVEGGDNSSIRLDLENMPQPDAFLLLLPPIGLQAFIDEDGYVSGAPEHVFEIAAMASRNTWYGASKMA